MGDDSLAQSTYEFAVERRYDIKNKIKELKEEKKKMDELIKVADEKR